jgi:RNA polymerase sigma-70 factor (ECF subfamily)
MSSEIAKLIQLARKGDTSAFREIVNKFQQMVYAVSLRMLNDVGKAEDMVQETFLQVWSKLSEYRVDKASFSTWIYTIVNRKCIDQLRQTKNELLLTQIHWDQLDGKLESADEDDMYNSHQSAEIIRQMSGSLSPIQKSVFVLKDLEGMDTEEVQLITGLSARQVKDNLYLARKSLRQKFESIKKLQDHE